MDTPRNQNSLKRPVRFIYQTLTSFILYVALLTVHIYSQEVPEKPNIIITYADDVGYGDVGTYGSELIPTPNIDPITDRGKR